MKKNEVFDSLFWRSLGIFLGVVALICLLPIVFTTFYTGIDFTDKGAIGDTIGGTMGPFVAIAAAGLTFLAFWVQFKANEQQRKDINDLKEKGEIEKVETKFFEMIKLHRDNVIELVYTPFKRVYGKIEKDDVLKEQIFEGRMVFREIYREFNILHEELKHFFQNINVNNLYNEQYLSHLTNNSEIKNRNFDLIAYAKVDILYSIIYFGLSTEGQKTLRDFFKGRYNKSFFENVIQFAALKPKVESDFWNKWNDIESKKSTRIKHFDRLIKDWINNVQTIVKLREEWQVDEELEYKHKYYQKGNYSKYYGGHQFRIGHYFRNLYQAVTLIDNDTRIDYHQKYSNIKIIRGQLSTYEQTIIFLNSLSILGRVWELENRNDPQKAIDLNNQLITKYNFIKNILNHDIIEGVNVSHFYPLVEFEAGIEENKKIEKENLKKLYK
jgi:hypothetical protein